jgi:ABC-type polysaccharide/polyol phosphate export permease
MLAVTFHNDMIEALKRSPALRYFCYDDIRMQYRRTFLGPLWVVVGACAWIAALSFVLSALFNQPVMEYLPYTAVGLFVWTYLSQPMVDGCNVFIGAATLIHSMRVPITFYALRSTLRYLMLYAHYLFVCMLILLVTNHPPGWLAFLAIPGIILHAFLAFGLLLLMGTFNARYRDVVHISGVLMQIMPLITPIAWRYDMLQKHQWVADYNPFYHLIQIVRAPLLGSVPTQENYFVSLATAVIVFLLGIYVYTRYHKRLIFWI